MSFLDNHYLTYAPVLDNERNPIATRLSVFGDGDAPTDPANVYAAVINTCRECTDPLLLSTPILAPSDKLTITEPADNLWLEIPADQTTSAEGAEWVSELLAQGFRLVLRDYPEKPLPDALQGKFELAIISEETDRRLRETQPNVEQRQVKTAISGVTTIAQMEQAFSAGASAVVGWPLDDAHQRDGAASSAGSFASVSRLLTLVNTGGEPEEMEQILSTDPTLAFRLFRYLNSPAFGLSVEIRSFEHALMMLGHKRMKKWLSLLLATASPEPNLNPLMFASVRRGFMLEKMASDSQDQQAKDEAFILGIFSMLDKMFCEPFEQLFDRLQIPDSVHEALVSQTGPAMPYLRLTQALESRPDDVINAQDDAFLSTRACNDVLMSSLTQAALAQQAN